MKELPIRSLKEVQKLCTTVKEKHDVIQSRFRVKFQSLLSLTEDHAVTVAKRTQDEVQWKRHCDRSVHAANQWRLFVFPLQDPKKERSLKTEFFHIFRMRFLTAALDKWDISQLFQAEETHALAYDLDKCENTIRNKLSLRCMDMLDETATAVAEAVQILFTQFYETFMEHMDKHHLSAQTAQIFNNVLPDPKDTRQAILARFYDLHKFINYRIRYCLGGNASSAGLVLEDYDAGWCFPHSSTHRIDTRAHWKAICDGFVVVESTPPTVCLCCRDSCFFRPAVFRILHGLTQRLPWTESQALRDRRARNRKMPELAQAPVVPHNMKHN